MDTDRFKYPWIIDNNNKAITYLENYNYIIFTGAYIGQYEIINTCKALNCNVCIYNLNTSADNYDVFNYNYETMITGNDKYNPFLPTILIGWANHNHYELLMALNMKEEEYPIGNYLLNNIENSKAYEISKNYNINKKDKSKLIKPIIVNIIEFINNRFVYNKSYIIPIITIVSKYFFVFFL